MTVRPIHLRSRRCVLTSVCCVLSNLVDSQSHPIFHDDKKGFPMLSLRKEWGKADHTQSWDEFACSAVPHRLMHLVCAIFRPGCPSCQYHAGSPRDESAPDNHHECPLQS